MSAYLNIRVAVPEWLDKIFAWPVLAYRKHKYDLAFRKIPLGDRLFAIVSPEDYYWLSKSNWVPRKHDGSITAVRFINDPDKETKISSMHREIMNQPEGLFVDHKNLVALDNTRENLRLATNSQNQFNRKKVKSKTSSRFMGVCLPKGRRKYEAYIKYGDKRIWLGSFVDEIEAARAYDETAKKYHGQFARLNFPDPEEDRRAELIRKITGVI